ncbi:MAG TPA: SagB/ThcOx family dehydrogenase [Rectinemataceae bacterium]|nr:SagB/ThcOx family dehydrogenase [Rectinemataceae bacterium]
MNDEFRDGRNFLKAGWERLDSIETDQARGVPVPVQEDPVADELRTYKLPPPDFRDSGQGSLFSLLSGRKSRRKYSPDGISLKELSFLLWAAQGVKDAKPKYSFRTVPSAGARHPLDLYLYIARVGDLTAGLYRYLPLEHELALVREESDPAALDAALNRQYWNAALVFIWAAVPYRTEWRYSVASHKLIALDAGHSCQNLYLACESLGLGTCAIGAYSQDKLDRYLGLDGEERFALYAAPVGKI